MRKEKIRDREENLERWEERGERRGNEEKKESDKERGKIGKASSATASDEQLLSRRHGFNMVLSPLSFLLRPPPFSLLVLHAFCFGYTCENFDTKKMTGKNDK